AGAPAGAATAAPVGAIVLIGAAIQMAVAVASQVAGRTGGVRADICIAWRSAGHSLRRSRLRYGATSPVAKREVARAGVRGMHADPSVTRPLEELIDAHARFAVGGMIVLSLPTHGDPAERALITRVTRTAGDLAIAVGHAVEVPARAGHMAAALARFEQAVTQCAAIADARMLTGIGAMRDGLVRAVAVVRAGVPRGGARSVPLAMSEARDPVRALFGAVSVDDLIVRHAVRLSLAIGAGTLIALAAHFPHSSWLPMTVAWVMRPDAAGTVVRTLARLAGTIAGVVIVGLVIAATGVSAVPVVALVLLGALLFGAFLLPNYAIATIGATAFIVAMFTFLGAPIITTADTRTYGTLIAGALALGATALIPSNTVEVVSALLGRLAGELSNYAALVRTAAPPAQRVAALEALTASRVAAGRVVEDSGRDARRHRIAPVEADRMLRDLVQAMAVVAADDLGGNAVPPQRVVDDSADLALRLDARQADEPVPPRRLPPAGQAADEAARAVDDAQAALDRALGMAPT
ncbi:MAG: FUSC family protein, partial [Acidobacteria bacterium]|nr:FUSC family protein [Acidobacteriota bacterium]